MDNKNISLWDPSRSLADNFFKSFWDGTPMSLNSMHTAIDMYEDDDMVTVSFNAPGFEKEDFEISVEDDILTVSGQVKQQEEQEDKKKKYYYKEMSNRSFTRSISLPVRVKAEESEAEYKKGVLTITLPKADEVKPKKIDIKAN